MASDRIKDIKQIRDIAFFDLETTGLIKGEHNFPDIIQIGARRGPEKFVIFAKPTKPITEEATKCNHITFENEVMKRDGEEMDYVDIQEALEKFIDFLKPNTILGGHYIGPFDIKVLNYHLRKNNLLGRFMELVTGYIDTYDIYKIIRPDIVGHSLQHLREEILGKQGYPSGGLRKSSVARSLVKQAVKRTPEWQGLEFYIEPYNSDL